jgi:2-succinyl-6-hydroxy-2,4-cyclohexadiene-1-carboxylate synthase
VALHGDRMGNGSPRLVLVHGFTQTGRSWRPIAARLAERHEIVMVDAPGHGGSSEVLADLDHGATLLAHAGGRAVYVGYSMGGRLCLHLALSRPDLVEGLVLVSATAGIEDDIERAERRVVDDALAAAVERDGVDAFLARWLARPMFEGLRPDDAGLADRRRNTAGGLASSLRLAGTGAQRPRWAELPTLLMPTLVVAGANDPKFAALARRMVERIGASSCLELIEEAGHAVPLEQPDRFLTALTAWLEGTFTTGP